MCIEYGKYAQKTLYNVRSKLIFDRRIDIVTVYNLVSPTLGWQSAPSALRTSDTVRCHRCRPPASDRTSGERERRRRLRRTRRRVRA